VPADPDLTEAKSTASPLDVTVIYAKHAQFLWRSLQRMGVAEADLPDALQEVLLVVHRRLGSLTRCCALGAVTRPSSGRRRDCATIRTVSM
jgi:hypothetical protein